MDPKDNRSSPAGPHEALLRVIRRQVPLVARPYERLGQQLGHSEREVLDRLRRLRPRPVREISGVFDAVRLGWNLSLVAFRTDAGGLDDAGKVVAAHPGVSHCYGRSGTYNLWFTLAVSPRGNLGLQRTITRLADLCRARSVLILPNLKQYKLAMPLAAEDLPVLSGRSPSGPDEPRTLRPARLELSDAQFRALGALQEDLPMIEEPFSPLAERAGLSPGELLSLAEGSLRSGWMRRYSALVDHRALGASANVLVAWRADAERADAAGAACAGLPAVSHCYLRPAADDWPYNLYTMIHGRDRAECLDAIGQIAQATGLAERAELWTLKEYKRRRARLLTDLEVCWEARSGPAGGL